MIETINNEYILQGYEIGKAQGELQGELKRSIHNILKLLRLRFKRVSHAIEEELNSRTDLIALESLFELAAQCDSLDEFADALK